MRKSISTLLFVLCAILTTSIVWAQEEVTITIRCAGNPQAGENWRCDNFAEVEEQVEQELGIALNLNLIMDGKAWADYKQEFVLASEAGEAPDIILSSHADIGAWKPAGYIIPLDTLIEAHSTFEDIVPELWTSQMYEGQIFGIPQDAEARPVFYSKPLLADLGWSEEEIDSLPERVQNGEFTFDDLIETAQQAIEEGVIEEGFGFWHRPTNGGDFLYFYYGMGGEVMDDGEHLIVERNALLKTYQLLDTLVETGVMRADVTGMSWEDWEPAVASTDRVLFAAGGTWMWADWARNLVADRGGNEFLMENLGLTLIPAMDSGVAITLTHPLSYMITTRAQERDVDEIAMALIAAVTTPEANNRHAIDSFHLGILTSQVESEAYLNNPILSSAHYMLNYTTALPNHPEWNAWANAYWLGIQAVETGESTPEEAVEIMLNQLQNEAPNIEVR